MTAKTNPTLIGAFMVGAFILLIGTIAALGSGSFLRKPRKLVAYFDSSVTGLQVGAPVQFRGVTVGEVTDMALVFNETDSSFVIPVVFEIWADKVKTSEGITLDQVKRDDTFAQNLIDKGLRAELKLMSFVTGQLFVQLDYHPGTEVRLVGSKEYSAFREVPTIPSEFSKLTKTIKDLPLKRLVSSIEKLLTDADGVIASKELRHAIASFGKLMDKGQVLVDDVDQQVAPISSEFIAVSKEARTALQSADGAFRSVDDLTAKGSPTQYKLDTTLDEISAAARALKLFASYLERHPEALLQGKEGGK